MTSDQVLGLLTAAGGWVSGEEMSRTLGVTRASIWKAVDALRREGYAVASAPRLGYRLETAPDKLSPAAISARLPAGLTLGGDIHCLDSVDSTNTYLKRLAAEGAPHGTVAIAHQQTGGRGRRGREFQSPAGSGLYLSLLLRPTGLPLNRLSSLTAWTAVAVCRAVEECCGLKPGIKWTNDIVLNGRKLCGILTELEFEGESGQPSHVVVGMGINLRQSREDFAALGLGEIATSLAAEGAAGVDRCALAACLIAALDEMYAAFPQAHGHYLAQYREKCVTLGKEVLVLRGEESLPARALSVEEDFSLRVRWPNGTEESLFAGEVSVRGLMGQYV